MSQAALLAVALVLDAILGEPDRLWRRVPHPAVLMGRAVSWIETRLNRGPARRLKGAAGLALLCLAGAGLGAALAALPLGGIVETLLAAILLAQKSLCDHVSAVAEALRRSLAEARRAVARIVGRDTAQLEPAGIARAAIESAAENFSDGVVAPALWFLVAGLPGMIVYKLVNTADSMIGHRSARYRDFGWAAARLDDLLNWIPARLTALLIAAVHLRFDAWHVIRRDARLHRSPNAGWPEAAMAVVLDVALAGPRSYDGVAGDDPYVHPEGRRDIGADQVDAALRALWRAWWAVLCLTAIAAVV